MNLYAITPSFLVNIQTLQHDTISAVLVLLCMILPLSVMLITLHHQTGEGRGCSLYVHCLISVFAAAVLIFTKGFSMTSLKGFFLFLILLKASVSDIKTRQVSDYYSIMILLTALIQAELSDLPTMLFGLVVVGLPQFIVAALKPGAYGGADIKITASAAFLLGVWKGLFALIIGLLAAVLIPGIVRFLKRQPINEGIPMIPYLSFGIFLAFIL